MVEREQRHRGSHFSLEVGGEDGRALVIAFAASIPRQLRPCARSKGTG
jgi:hypothetical protein